MEDSIKDILAGKHVPVDHILKHQSEDGMKTIPVTKRNVCYICCTILFNEEGQVLLIQEAKPSCYGQWYLPAGRLEPGETIVDGAKREVKEEAGLECDLTTLLCVELNGSWMRFTFIGVVTGGQLKTLDEKDKESLQAKFFHIKELPNPIRPTKLRSDPDTPISQGGFALRCNDILKLIDLGHKYRKKKSHEECLPVIFPHKFISYRFVIIDKSGASSMHILASNKGERLCIPTTIGNVQKSVPEFAMVASILNAAFGMTPSQCSFKMYGVLAPEHRGTGDAGEDGVCVTLLVSLDLKEDAALPGVTSQAEFAWHVVTCSHLQTRLSDGCNNNIVPLL